MTFVNDATLFAPFVCQIIFSGNFSVSQSPKSVRPRLIQKNVLGAVGSPGHPASVPLRLRKSFLHFGRAKSGARMLERWLRRLTVICLQNNKFKAFMFH